MSSGHQASQDNSLVEGYLAYKTVENSQDFIYLELYSCDRLFPHGGRNILGQPRPKLYPLSIQRQPSSQMTTWQKSSWLVTGKLDFGGCPTKVYGTVFSKEKSRQAASPDKTLGSQWVVNCVLTRSSESWSIIEKLSSLHWTPGSSLDYFIFCYCWMVNQLCWILLNHRLLLLCLFKCVCCCIDLREQLCVAM